MHPETDAQCKGEAKKNGNMEKIFALVENNNVVNYSFNQKDGYSEIVLTDSQKAEIQSILDSFENGMKAIRERREYRMKNYYDCVDDYSFGGICDQADNQLQNELEITRNIRIQEVLNGGFYIRKSEFYRLSDENGNSTTGTHSGRYGDFFVINDKCVSVPKKVATLEKKGYTLEKIERTYKCTYKGFSNKGNVMCQTMEIASETITKVTEMPDYIGNLSYIDWQYDAYFSQD